LPFHTIVPRFNLREFWWASADLIDGHPLLFGILLAAAVLFVWKCGKVIGQEWEIRSVRQAMKRDREQAKKLQRVVAISSRRDGGRVA